MSGLERLTDRMATAIATPAPDGGPIRREWGTIKAVNTDGTYDVETGASATTIPGVSSIAGTFIVGERCTVDFVASDVMLSGRVEDRWHTVGGTAEPAFLNGWTAFGPPWTAPRFRKVVGLVYLSGLIAHPAGSVAASQAFTLPAGYRPLNRLLLPSNGFGAAEVTTRVDVWPTGEVILGANNAAGTYVALSVTPFHAEQ